MSVITKERDKFLDQVSVITDKVIELILKETDKKLSQVSDYEANHLEDVIHDFMSSLEEQSHE